ncbi:MAG: hypothetical protein Q9184_005354 [Pyrenodesmia sp. 2 TL-2023]
MLRKDCDIHSSNRANAANAGQVAQLQKGHEEVGRELADRSKTAPPYTEEHAQMSRECATAEDLGAAAKRRNTGHQANATGSRQSSRTPMSDARPTPDITARPVNNIGKRVALSRFSSLNPQGRRDSVADIPDSNAPLN